MVVRDRPLFTDIYSKLEEFIPDEGSAYVYGESQEERSSHYEQWQSKSNNVKFVNIEDQQLSYFSAKSNGSIKQTLVRSEKELKEFWKQIDCNKIYLDITGLAHHVWAPLLKMALLTCQQVIAVYVEPIQYRFSAAPKEGEIFDLSERILGIAPIPGFVSLKEPRNEMEVYFIPLLGFEGTRLAFMIEQVQPPGDKILPVIGVPGFRPEFPFYAYHGNQLPLAQSHAWRNVKFAMANCPYSLFYVLEDISKDYPGNYFKIAPIGTKPHALGAVLFAIINQDNVELVYDHPIRKAKRTKGSARLLVYHLSAFVSSP